MCGAVPPRAGPVCLAPAGLRAGSHPCPAPGKPQITPPKPPPGAAEGKSCGWSRWGGGRWGAVVCAGHPPAPAAVEGRGAARQREMLQPGRAPAVPPARRRRSLRRLVPPRTPSLPLGPPFPSEPPSVRPPPRPRRGAGCRVGVFPRLPARPAFLPSCCCLKGDLQCQGSFSFNHKFWLLRIL